DAVLALVEVDHLGVMGLTEETAEFAETNLRLFPPGLQLEHPSLDVGIADRRMGPIRNDRDGSPQEVVRVLERVAVRVLDPGRGRLATGGGGLARPGRGRGLDARGVLRDEFDHRGLGLVHRLLGPQLGRLHELPPLAATARAPGRFARLALDLDRRLRLGRSRSGRRNTDLPLAVLELAQGDALAGSGFREEAAELAVAEILLVEVRVQLEHDLL